jgi:uncharacterized Tic20 family protein
MADTNVKQPSTSATQNKTNAILAWVFAPITSFIFMNDKDEFTKKCAKHSMYFGVADFIIWVLLILGSTFGGILTFGIGTICCTILMLVWSAASIAVRIIGAVKANNGELFEVPLISKMVKE